MVARLSVDFPAEILQARTKWNDIVKVEDKYGWPRILYPAKLTFSYEGEIKAFSDTQNLPYRKCYKEFLK